MPSSASFRTFVMDQLSRIVSEVRARSMFGGFGIYAGDVFFALIANDTLYFKVDDSNRPDFEKLGMKTFQPYREGSEAMKYSAIPDGLLEDPDALRPWAETSIAVARDQKKVKRIGK